MESTNEDSQATQQATQNALDPRRVGQQNSGFSDEDMSEIICVLYPNSESATREVLRIASSPEYSPHITGRYTADAIDSDLYLEDDARQFGRTRGMGDHAIVLRMSSTVKSPELGFAFGRNTSRCDICFQNDPYRRLSNIHFRIYVNEHGVVMLEDQSTNGTIVDDVLLNMKKQNNRSGSKRMLQSGSTIKIFMHENAHDLTFIVRIPRREEELEEAFQKNLMAYLGKSQPLGDVDRTIGPGSGGHVNLFPQPMRKNENRDASGEVTRQAETPRRRLPREWRGGAKYNRAGVIGKGAFATVYKVTSKFDGLPYAAKELDKRKFMKNGVLDQKVENEMKIMQKVQHGNIVQYIEHFDWDLHQFIIIMEYVPGGDLGRLVQENGAINEPYVKIIAKQLIDALGYLHENKITHRDVKPDNILIQSTSPELIVKLTDFGLSKMIDTEQTFLKTFCGTLLYCAPEVYSEYSTYDEKGRRSRQRSKTGGRERYDNAVDVWSLGGVLFYAMTGCPPFPVKNGISYTELLHHIMTKDLDLAPLVELNVSSAGIDFLRRMIDRRPENRATIVELQAHPWLAEGNVGESFDEISDNELEQGASQLSLTDRHHEPMYRAESMNSRLMAPDEGLSVDFEDDKENYTFGQHRPARLWGEVNNSAIGSSGAIAEERLNIPMSTTSLDETEILDSEILDSFDSEEATPRQKQPRAQGILASDRSLSADNTRSMASQLGSQSLGGAESIMENLNMRSLARTESRPQSRIININTSKRKPAYDTSDEFETPGASFNPSIKRLKSMGGEYVPDEVDEYSLVASVPPIAKNESGRGIDYPVHKKTFWDSHDKQTWHLKYPEMSHFQLTAFKIAAVRRREEFGPGKTPLWDLAMRCFPPSRKVDGCSESSPELPPALLRRDSRSLGETEVWDLPPTDPLADSGDVVSLPDTIPAESQIPSHSPGTPKTAVARFFSTVQSVVPGVVVSVTDAVLSWGRERDNTVRYPNGMESRIPKYAFRLLLWREACVGSSDELRPWETHPTVGSATMRVSPDPDSFSFYISTKATNGIRINGNQLHPNDPKNPASPSKHWMKLHHGDVVSVWGLSDHKSEASFSFECFWGGSSTTRPSDQPPSCVPESIGRKLDSIWPRAERNLHYDKIKAEATLDQQCRMKLMTQEQEKSRLFEQRRAEAVKVLAIRANRDTSPSSTQHVMGRTIPKFRHTSPLCHLESISS